MQKSLAIRALGLRSLPQSINGPYKAEVIHHCIPWQSFEAVEYEALEWVNWFNNRFRRGRKTPTT
jgi:hypothetical protein